MFESGTVVEANGTKAFVHPECKCTPSAQIGNKCPEHDSIRIRIHIADGQLVYAEEGKIVLSRELRHRAGPLPLPKVGDRVLMETALGPRGFYAVVWVYAASFLRAYERLNAPARIEVRPAVSPAPVMAQA